MSQRLAYNTLKMLGGTADIKTIASEIRRIDPSLYVNRNIYTLMRRLEVWQYVSWNPKTEVYTIIAEYPETIINNTPILESDIINE